MDVEIEIPARAGGVLAQQPGLIGLVDRGLQHHVLVEILAAHIDVAGMGPHADARDQAALDQRMRIVADDVAVLAGARLGLIAIHDEVGWTPVRIGLGHEAPLHAGREAGAAAATQAGLLQLLDDPVAALGDDRRRAVPVPAAHRLLQVPGMQTVEVGEDAVLVAQRHGYASPFRPNTMAGSFIGISSSVLGPPSGALVWRPMVLPGRGRSPRFRDSISSTVRA
jgi:hypothetical protein